MTVGARLRVPVPQRTLVGPDAAGQPVHQPTAAASGAALRRGQFDKTTLLQQWLAQVVAEPGLPDDRLRGVAWVSLDESDDRPGQFLTDLVGAVGAVDGALAARALAFWPMAGPSPRTSWSVSSRISTVPPG